MAEETAYDKAITAHQEGNLEEAIASYRAILQDEPEHVGALHHLGLALHQTGQHVESEKHIQAAVNLAPQDADAWANLGAVLRALKRRTEACEAFRHALAADPGHPAAASNLGVVLAETGRSADAVEVLKAVDEALPGRPPIQKHLGLSLLRLGRPREALPYLQNASKARTHDLDLQNDHGLALMEVGENAAAAEQFQSVLKANPNHRAAMVNLGELLTEGGDYEAAGKLLHRALELDPKCAEARNNLGVLQGKQGNHDAAAVSLRRSLEINPLYVPAHHNLANQLLADGDLAPALEALHRAAKLDPQCIPAWYSLACTGKHVFSPAEITHIEDLLDAPERTDSDRMLLNFALAHALEKTEPSLAFEHATKANQLRHAELETRGQAYNPAAHTALVDSLIATFTPELFTQLADVGNDSEVPMFVVGMPRSGTTLMEQVLASHPDVFAAGELEDLTLLAQDIPGYPASLSSIEHDKLKALAETHLAQLRSLGGEAKRVVDKMTVNFLRLGLIAILFPSARIIHTRREPKDIALSCFFQNFAAPGLAFTFDLEHLAHFYREYERLMDHWRKALPIPIHEVTYEDFVGDPEPQTRTLVGFAGLNWDDRCLVPHETKRRVKTASVLQVREPIYTRSIARWHNFAEQLGTFPEIPVSQAPTESGRAASK
jgi:Flp pilus assembly protein TadD